jgi:Domain of unknown function (DUF4258)
MNTQIAKLLRKVGVERVKFTAHALQRMKERGISKQEVFTLLKFAEPSMIGRVQQDGNTVKFSIITPQLTLVLDNALNLATVYRYQRENEKEWRHGRAALHQAV